MHPNPFGFVRTRAVERFEAAGENVTDSNLPSLRADRKLSTLYHPLAEAVRFLETAEADPEQTCPGFECSRRGGPFELS